jgi:tRNA(Ile)-lysidine synthetase-like protein
MASLDPFRTTAALLPPGGRFAVGVSGGADSVALLRLLCARGDLSLHVVHLDHQTRGAASTADAQFVGALAASLNLPCTIRTRAQAEASVAAALPTNPSARFRALRLMLFREVVAAHALDGAALAHHADDVAETVLHRLLRRSGAAGLAGIEAQALLAGVIIVRPLLGVRRDALREHLRSIGQPWREDESNSTPRYGRNRLRSFLAEQPQLTQALLDLSAACRLLRGWIRGSAPALPESFPLRALHDLPDILARESARRWLTDHGAPPNDLAPPVLDRLICLARDAATPAHQHFPGRLHVRRRGGQILAVAATAAVPDPADTSG